MAFFLTLILLGVSVYYFPVIIRSGGEALGWYLRRKTQQRRELLLERAAEEERDVQQSSKSAADEDDWEKVESVGIGTVANGGKAGDEWKGVVGFFHPFCNAGGGGERVLWAAIRATQQRWPEALCVVYTGDHDADKETIINRVQNRFNIPLHGPRVHFLYLSTRHYVLASTYPHFTLLGQSLGSIVLAYDAFTLLVPDIFIDTMGYAFSLAFCSLLFPDVPTGAYVHYPTISTDMLGSLEEGGQGVNAGTGAGLKGQAKKQYWHFFAYLYSRVGASIDVVMTNSSWTQSHIQSLWGPGRAAKRQQVEAETAPSAPKDSTKTTSASPPAPSEDITVVFPPVAVEEIASAIPITAESAKNRKQELLYIAQFRPEKNHTLILEAFAQLINSYTDSQNKDSSTPSTSQERPHLTLIGSVRDPDDATRVYTLRLLAHELKIKEDVTFLCDASWEQILQALGRASVGVNAMWNEHFGIGVVEYQAAGLVGVVHDSGGPKRDIVVEIDGEKTGFHATTAEQFAKGFRSALSLSPEDDLAMRLRARKSAARFTEKAFKEKWIGQVEKLVKLREVREKREGEMKRVEGTDKPVLSS
ncbi:glycosyltransferase family 4 protein [Aulographum hederae CBS 113979]|uniref:GDP-Man:Man(3)GlcNAc(2)-PP-Dol alpha-1,2-mannosyltransferase n=1 Tax=Aulographum hederae CBS 113979 TaxID=1176131 RepID=A0A6G1GQ36_9PEZI|nr:glycosyltransferase family 4 protein [Aulographum hederae CBS 113979]